MRTCFIVHAYDDGATFRTIYYSYDFANNLRKLNDDMNSCYYDWEIKKHWNMD